MSQSQESGQETRQRFHRLEARNRSEEKQCNVDLDIAGLRKQGYPHRDLPPWDNWEGGKATKKMTHMSEESVCCLQDRISERWQDPREELAVSWADGTLESS